MQQHTSRRDFLKLAGLGAASVGLTFPMVGKTADASFPFDSAQGRQSLENAAGKKMNVLFLFADDQRADTIAALGNPIIQTPNLDKLCRRGLAFQRAYMQGSFNGATCIPSRAMLLSGQPLFHCDERLRNETWPAAFGRAGYATFMSGKWHNHPTSLIASFQQARAVFVGGMTNPLHAELHDVADGKLVARPPAHQHACATFADEAIKFLQNVGDKPFFCYVPFDAPHDPHVVPEDFPVSYDAAKIQLPPCFLPQHPFDNGEMLIRDEVLLPHPRPPDAVRQMIADYYRYITYLDSLIGRILDVLEKSPHAANTIVVFSADSGVARGSHGLIGKQNLYELDSLRVPLIIAGPGIVQNKTTDAMCYLWDVLPTLGALCGVAAPPQSEGQNFAAVLRAPEQPARGVLAFAYKDVQRAVCDGRWKLIRYPQVDRTQLFDLQADPHEAHDLAAQPEHAERIKSLLALLAAQQKFYGDQQPLTIAHPQSGDWTPAASGKQKRKAKKQDAQ